MEPTSIQRVCPSADCIRQPRSFRPQLPKLWRLLAQRALAPTSVLTVPGNLPLTGSSQKPQLRYVQHYCDTLFEALDSDEDGNVEIDMDAVADAAHKNTEKPSFYVSEESQQRKFNCAACNEFNDILGRIGYCSQCGTRNDLAEFEDNIVPAIRAQLNTGSEPEDCVRSAVAAFDSLCRLIGRELANLIPMSRRRKQRLLKQGFHDLSDVANRIVSRRVV